MVFTSGPLVLLPCHEDFQQSRALEKGLQPIPGASEADLMLGNLPNVQWLVIAMIHRAQVGRTVDEANQTIH